MNWPKIFTKIVVKEKEVERTVWPKRYKVLEVIDELPIGKLFYYLEREKDPDTGLMVRIHGKNYWIKLHKV